MFCTNCGTEIKMGAKYCTGCGEKVPSEAVNIETSQPSFQKPIENKIPWYLKGWILVLISFMSCGAGWIVAVGLAIYRYIKYKEYKEKNIAVLAILIAPVIICIVLMAMEDDQKTTSDNNKNDNFVAENISDQKTENITEQKYESTEGGYIKYNEHIYVSSDYEDFGLNIPYEVIYNDNAFYDIYDRIYLESHEVKEYYPEDGQQFVQGLTRYTYDTIQLTCEYEEPSGFFSVTQRCAVDVSNWGREEDDWYVLAHYFNDDEGEIDLTGLNNTYWKQDVGMFNLIDPYYYYEEREQKGESFVEPTAYIYFHDIDKVNILEYDRGKVEVAEHNPVIKATLYYDGNKFEKDFCIRPNFSEAIVAKGTAETTDLRIWIIDPDSEDIIGTLELKRFDEKYNDYGNILPITKDEYDKNVK